MKCCYEVVTLLKILNENFANLRAILVGDFGGVFSEKTSDSVKILPSN